MESTIFTALIYLGLGAVLLFFGIKLVRVIIGIYGALAGYWLGYEIVQALNWWSWLEWVIVIVSTILVALLAVAFHQFLVAVAIAYFLFALTFSIIVALGGDRTAALIVSAIGGFIYFFIIRNGGLVNALFAIVTSFQGAALLIAAVLLFTDPNAVDKVLQGQALSVVTINWFWTIIWVILAFVGVYTQTNRVEEAT